jgi:N-acetyl-anhydromuramyl-L-alanine amidase AmpD
MAPEDGVLPHVPVEVRPLADAASRLRRADETVELAVLHAMAETVIDTDGEAGDAGQRYGAREWLELLGISAHGLVTPDGRLVELVDPAARVAYHAKGFNSRTVGVEFLVAGAHDYASFLRAIGVDPVRKKAIDPPPASPFTEAQYAAGGFWLAGRGLPWSAVRDHAELDPGRKHDPGPLFDRARLRRWFDRWLAAPAETRAT